MATVSISLPSDGQTIDASDVNTPINAILSEFNGNIDDNNIKTGANINGSKILAASLSGSKLDTTTAGGWIAGGLPAVSSVTENGNRSADITFASTVASILTPGMRIRTSRTVAAPTGAILLNGTTQYASKTTPAGMTFTDDFVVSAWVKMSSYAQNTIASRWNGTSGWQMYVNSSGQVGLYGYNAAAGNNSYVVSYQSLPLNKWVHVAVQLDMSAFTATTTTSYVMIDGLDVPASVARNGTNPTALVQAGNLEIGGNNGGLQPFPGNIAQVAIYNAKVTQANIRLTKNQTLSGSETSLISAYKLDQASGLNDLNANANNLTANGSPTYSVASPFTTDANGVPAGTYDWAIVTRTNPSTPTVATVQYPEGCAIPTSGGISTVDYSGVKAPFGMPVDAGRWRVNLLWRTQTATASNATYAAFTGMNFIVPIGAWYVGWAAGLYNLTTTQVNWNLSDVSQTGLTITAADLGLTTAIVSPSAASVTNQNFLSRPASLSAAATFTMYTLGATTSAGILGSQTKCELFAELSYL